MKILIFALSLFTTLAATAQVDVKLNAGSLITLGLNGSVEVPISPRSSLAIGVARSSLGLTVDDDEYNYRNLRLVPEYRYYFAPLRGHDRWFAGAYGKAIDLRGEDVDNDRSVHTNRVAVGIMGGHKWIAPSGFIFEFNLGAGRGMTFGSGDVAFERAIGTLTAIDLRLGLLVGWRIGEKNRDRGL